MGDKTCDISKSPWGDIESVFPALDVETAQRVIWRKQTDHSENGVYWAGTDRNGIHWVSDGFERMAVLPDRAFRFYRFGVAARRGRLTERYLHGLVGAPHGAQVINFGANIGELAVEFASQGAAVMAIEPDPGIVPYLRANAAGRRIEVVPFAAWRADTAVDLYLRTESADSSVFNISERWTPVTARKIDTLTAVRDIKRVHLLIGDAEGAEPEVLEGAQETLKITEYVSICASAERRGESTLEACEAILKASGFDIIHREETGFCTLIAKSRNM
jgi:FkbM family methyltransferase